MWACYFVEGGPWQQRMQRRRLIECSLCTGLHWQDQPSGISDPGDQGKRVLEGRFPFTTEDWVREHLISVSPWVPISFAVMQSSLISFFFFYFMFIIWTVNKHCVLSIRELINSFKWLTSLQNYCTHLPSLSLTSSFLLVLWERTACALKQKPNIETAQVLYSISILAIQNSNF